MLVTSRCAADTMPQCTPFWRRNNPAPSPFSIHGKEYMKRTWDESKSPQWRYLLSKDSEIKRARNSIFRGGTEEENVGDISGGEGEIKRNKPGKKVARERKKREERREKQFTKSGKEIVYSASPGRPPVNVTKLK